MNLAIVKYNAGNIQSVLNALERLGVHAEVTDNIEKITSADKVIFPGVGEASSAMKSLRESNLDTLIPSLKQPVLGICVGMQLLCEHSEENDTDCLGIVPIKVRKFATSPFSILDKEKQGATTSPFSAFDGKEQGGATSPFSIFDGEGQGMRFKVPQVGWNNIYDLKTHLFNGVKEKSYIYNVHSYYAEESEYTIAKCDYTIEYAAAIRKDNFYGVQFHTEKSAEVGDIIIKNFLEL